MTAERLAELTRIQDAILDQAAALVTANGCLAYATCSVLEAENEARQAAFLARLPEWECIAARRWEPGLSGDGFFLAQFRRHGISIF